MVLFPAFADPSAEESAWKTKKAKKELVSDPPAKVFIQDGWSVLVVQTFEDCRMADTGVCQAARGEAEEAIRELRSEKGLAILTTKAGQRLVKKVHWKRYLVQLGTVPSCTSVQQPEVCVGKTTFGRP